jgi:uncharacterized protein (DUF58 family)
MNFFAKSQFSRKFVERHQKTYILPTLYGMAFGVVCILLLGIAFASTNNAVYFLCFLLTVLGVQSLVITNQNTEKLGVAFVEVEDFFADETGFARVSLQNATTTDLHGLQIETAQNLPAVLSVLPAGERKEIQVPLKYDVPGEQKMPGLKISSDFPFHFARSWKKFYSEVSFAVFPARRGQSEFPPGAFADPHLHPVIQDEFKSHREYQTSDSPRRIDWKVTARTERMMVKEYDQQTATQITLRWEDCPQSSEDERKSQLSLWIDLAEKKNYEYALKLPQRRVDFGRGPRHRLQCLRALL